MRTGDKESDTKLRRHANCPKLREASAQKIDNPGRTFLGKRRYFSGIAALTPLTPLTYKQNAVNAFIPTKKRR